MKVPKILTNSRVVIVVATVAVVLVAFGGVSAYAAHSNALPGSPLYPLKQLWEQGQLIFSFNPTAKAQAHINIAQNRLQSLQSAPVSAPVALPTIQDAQQHLNNALDQLGGITDTAKRKEVKKEVSNTAGEIETEVSHESDNSDTSSSDKQNIQQASDELKQTQAQSSTDD